MRTEDMVTISGIARRIRRSYNWTRDLMKEKGAPDPEVVLDGKKIYDWKKVERYLQGRIGYFRTSLEASPARDPLRKRLR